MVDKSENIEMSTYESLFPNLDESGSLSIGDKSKETSNTTCGGLTTRTVLKSLILGQGLSVLLSGTGVFSGLLQQEGVNIPTAQSFPMYFLLCLIFTTQLACKGGDRSIVSVLRHDGWKYALLAIIDVEANFLVVKAYAYTSVTSVQLLDCFAIASVLLLSRVFLGTVYRTTHYVGVIISLLGLGGLVAADVISGKNGAGGGGTNPVLGDVLVIGGAILYGVCNTGQEFAVKKYEKSEFLGMMGLFGSVVSGIQMIIVESKDVAKVDFSSYKVALPFFGFVVFLLLIYTCMSYVIEQTSATLTNISILSADFYSLIIGILVFKYSFHYLYFIAFAVVIVGVAVYSVRPTEESSPSTTPSSVNDDSGEAA